MLIFLGLVGVVVSAIALDRGSLPSIGIKTRNAGISVLVISIIVFIAGVSISMPSNETVSKNTNIEQNYNSIEQNEVSEEDRQNAALNLFKSNLDGLAEVELDRQNKTFNILPTNETSLNVIAILGSNPTSEAEAMWDNVVKGFKELSKELSKTLPGYTVSYVNPYGTTNRLLIVIDGVVTYNFIK